jgi:hypothetical protein
LWLVRTLLVQLAQFTNILRSRCSRVSITLNHSKEICCQYQYDSKKLIVQDKFTISIDDNEEPKEN